jgi:hypothetical protein
MSPRRLAPVFLAVLGLVGCGGERARPAVADSTAGRVAPAVDSTMILISRGAAVAIAVDAAPGRADSILTAEGMTPDDYERLMYRIAADTAMSRLFQQALQGR